MPEYCTGSARGIGRSTSRLLAELGATVYLTDRRTKDIISAADHISAVVPGYGSTLSPEHDSYLSVQLHPA